jgi:Cu-processing system permease protein
MDPALLEALALIFLNLAVVTAVALFFSTYSSPMLSAVFTLGVYIAGQFNADLKHFDSIVSAPAVVAVAKACYYVLPDFAKFDVKLAVVHGIPVSGAYMASTAAYAVMYVAALLFGAMMIFSRRDFK